MQLVSQTVHSLPGYAFLHDFAVTPQHYVVFQNPVHLSLAPFILGQQAPAQCVDWAEGEPMQVGTPLLRCTQALPWGRAHHLLTVVLHPRQGLCTQLHCSASPVWHRTGSAAGRKAQPVEAPPVCMKALRQCISCRLQG